LRVYKKIGIPNTPLENTKLKDLKNFVQEFEAEVVRKKLKEYKYYNKIFNHAQQKNNICLD
jgi:hypothetical protein